MSTEATLLRQIRNLLIVIASCAVVTLVVGFFLVFWPEAYHWILRNRFGIIVVTVVLSFLAAIVGVGILFFVGITKDDSKSDTQAPTTRSVA